jgi:alpha-ribazole phosphatase
MVQIYLIRHPEPPDAVGLCYGRADLKVTASAIAATVAAVRTEIPEAVRGAPIYTSPLSRCRELAHELAAPREPMVSSDLSELHFGAWEGLSWEAVPRPELDAWAEDTWAYRPGGGESAAMAAARWHRWSQELKRSGAKTALAITHAGLIRVAMACEGVWSRESFHRHPIAFGSVHRLILAEDARPASVSA